MVSELVEEYNNHVFLPLLVKVTQHLNPQFMEVYDDARIWINKVAGIFV